MALEGVRLGRLTALKKPRRSEGDRHGRHHAKICGQNHGEASGQRSEKATAHGNF